MTDEPKRKLMVGDHPVSPFGRTEAYADDEYWEEKAKRLQDERDTLAAALAAAQQKYDRLTGYTHLIATVMRDSAVDFSTLEGLREEVRKLADRLDSLKDENSAS